MKFGCFTTLENYIQELEAERRTVSCPDYQSCLRILELASEIQSDALFGVGYYFLAEFYLAREDYAQTMNCLTDCTKFFQQAQMYEYLARTYNMMGVVSDRQNNRSVALIYYYSCQQYADRYGHIYVRAIAEYNIAGVLARMKKFPQAAESYSRSIRDFTHTQENMRRNSNLVRAMLLCGFCHMEQHKITEAVQLWEQIQQLMQEYPGSGYPQISLLAYQAGMMEAQGEKEAAGEIIMRLFDSIRSREDFDEVSDVIVEIFKLMERLGNEEQIEKLIGLLEELGVEDYPSVLLEIYPYKSKRLLRQGRTGEYIRCTKQYFKLYVQSQADSRSVMVRMLELQDKLREVEQEQYSIQEDNARLASMAWYDSLTGLPNRTYLNEYLAQAFDRAQKEQQPIGVELMDIDYFKQFNDTYGHLAGDSCLEAVAEVLKDIQSSRIFCARYGGDEFMIIYSGMTAQEVQAVMEEIRLKVRGKAIPHEASRTAAVVTVSQGTVHRIPMHKNREWDFSKTADIALYRAKDGGRNGYCLWERFEE